MPAFIPPLPARIRIVLLIDFSMTDPFYHTKRRNQALFADVEGITLDNHFGECYNQLKQLSANIIIVFFNKAGLWIAVMRLQLISA